MKLSVLENFEEKFYFKTSHLFWHLITGIAGLALISGVLVLLWGITPSLKPSVTKAIYPEPFAVTANEVLLQIRPPQSPQEVETLAKTVADNGDVSMQPAAPVDSTELALAASIDSLKVLLPAEKFPWKSRGHWQEQRYRRRQWIVDVWGISDRLNAAFEKTNAYDNTEKNALLQSYIALLSPFPEKLRFDVLISALSNVKDHVVRTQQNIDLLTEAVPLFGTEKADFISTLATFGRKNPRDGQDFINYMNTILPQFPPENRLAMLDELIKSYYEYFDDIGMQREATEMFLPMLGSFAADQQPKAVGEFYRLYLAKNADRANKIAEIDAIYQQELANANYRLASKEAAKAGYRTLGLQVFGGAVVAIAFIALFLVLLSIQRNIRLLRERGFAGN